MRKLLLVILFALPMHSYASFAPGHTDKAVLDYEFWKTFYSAISILKGDADDDEDEDDDESAEWK